MKHLHIVTIALVLLFFPQDGFAQSRIEPIPAGITEVDFDGDGESEILVKARYENFKPSSYDTVTVYKKAADGKLIVVPYIDKFGNLRDSKHTVFQPAWGCERQQIGLRKDENGTVKIVSVEQDGKPAKPKGNTFFIALRAYELRHDKSQSAGTPEWYFGFSDSDFIEADRCGLESVIGVK